MANQQPTVLRPKLLLAQWQTASSRFDVALFNAETEMGNKAVAIFKKSFYLKRFNSKSEPKWSPTKMKNPILVDTGQLRDSITWKSLSNDNIRAVSIYTDPNYRVKADKRHNRTYAEIHNEGIGEMAQRQFMGDSSYIDDMFDKISNKIFNVFTR